jgi:hypothetical protein
MCVTRSARGGPGSESARENRALNEARKQARTWSRQSGGSWTIHQVDGRHSAWIATYAGGVPTGHA